MTRYFRIANGKISNLHAQDEEAIQETGMIVIHDYGYTDEPRWVASYSRFVRNAEGYTEDVLITKVYQADSKFKAVYSDSPLLAIKALKNYIRQNGVR